jgi:hypothetical protein
MEVTIPPTRENMDPLPVLVARSKVGYSWDVKTNMAEKEVFMNILAKKMQTVNAFLAFSDAGALSFPHRHDTQAAATQEHPTRNLFNLIRCSKGVVRVCV